MTRTTQTPDLTPEEQPADTTTETTQPPPSPVKVRAPGFKKSPRPTTPPSSPDEAAGSSSASDPDSLGMSDELPEPEPTKSGSSRTSSRVEKQALRDAVRVAFGGATNAAHDLLVKDEFGKAAALYLADEQDLDAISEPGGNLLARRMGDGPVNADTADAIALLIALAGYALKQLGRLRWARQLRQTGAAVNGPQLDLTGVGEQLEEPPEPEPTYGGGLDLPRFA